MNMIQTATSDAGTATTAVTKTQITTEDLKLIRTPSGKKIEQFKISDKLLTGDPELVDYIMRSESMKDTERQYWFNLSQVMKPEQIEKLREILRREREKLAAIDKKYGKKTVNPIQAAKQAQRLAQERSAKQNKLKAKEAAQELAESAKENDILAELDGL